MVCGDGIAAEDKKEEPMESDQQVKAVQGGEEAEVSSIKNDAASTDNGPADDHAYEPHGTKRRGDDHGGGGVAAKEMVDPAKVPDPDEPDGTEDLIAKVPLEDEFEPVDDDNVVTLDSCKYCDDELCLSIHFSFSPSSPLPLTSSPTSFLWSLYTIVLIPFFPPSPLILTFITTPGNLLPPLPFPISCCTHPCFTTLFLPSTDHCDLHFKIRKDGLGGCGLTDSGFATMWAGARATQGVKGGKYFYECKVEQNVPVTLSESEAHPNVLRWVVWDKATFG